MPTREELAWAAGLFEGEGSITASCNHNKSSFSVALSLSMTDQEIVERFARIFPVGNLIKVPVSAYGAKRGQRWQDQWRWGTSTTEASKQVLLALEPFLGQRRLGRMWELLEAAEARQKDMRHERPCVVCGRTFQPKVATARARYCSGTCRNRRRSVVS